MCKLCCKNNRFSNVAIKFDCTFVAATIKLLWKKIWKFISKLHHILKTYHSSRPAYHFGAPLIYTLRRRRNGSNVAVLLRSLEASSYKFDQLTNRLTIASLWGEQKLALTVKSACNVCIDIILYLKTTFDRNWPRTTNKSFLLHSFPSVELTLSMSLWPIMQSASLPLLILCNIIISFVYGFIFSVIWIKYFVIIRLIIIIITCRILCRCTITYASWFQYAFDERNLRTCNHVWLKCL